MFVKFVFCYSDDHCSSKRKANVSQHKVSLKYITKTVVIVFQVQSQIFVISAVLLAIGAKFLNATNHHPEENFNSLNNNYREISLKHTICFIKQDTESKK